MLRPIVRAGVEEPNQFTTERVKRRCLFALIVVAKGASKPKIVSGGLTTQRKGQEVINFHRRPHNPVGGQAIATPMAGLRGNPRAENF